MSFRRDGTKARYWRKPLEKFPDLLEQAGLPDAVLQDDQSFSFFLQEGCFQVTRDAPLIDAMSFFTEQQLGALHTLLSHILSEQEQVGNELWTKLERRFRSK